MPTDGTLYEYRNESARIAAWRRHYMAKGANSTKASDCAARKVRRKRTWPPGHLKA